MKILIINGPNLNLLGKRDAEQYGAFTLEDLEKEIKAEFGEHDFVFEQSNSEGEIVNLIQAAADKFDGIIINPGGYAHSSVAIRDALADCKLPKVEVHISHLANREDFRQKLVTTTGCNGYISGFRINSYKAGVYLLEKMGASQN